MVLDMSHFNIKTYSHFDWFPITKETIERIEEKLHEDFEVQCICVQRPLTSKNDEGYPQSENILIDEIHIKLRNVKIMLMCISDVVYQDFVDNFNVKFIQTEDDLRNRINLFFKKEQTERLFKFLNDRVSYIS
jgi:hypothetical protein